MLLGLLVVLGIAAVVLGWRLVRTCLRYRGACVVTCPENRRPAGVHLDERHVALTAWKSSPELRLSACTRWPERENCAQTCLADIQASPESCLVRNILTDWYRGKVCASCGQPFGDIEWNVQKPALVTAEKQFVEWTQVPAERLRETLETALPVCFACHMANTLVREHPDLVVDRGAHGARRITS